MASGFRMANPAEYRRGVILGLTLAEILMLLVFLLLLSSGAILARRAREMAALRASISKYDSLMAPIAEQAARRGISVRDTDQLVSLIVRGAEAEGLRQELGRKESELAAARAAEARATAERDKAVSQLSEGAKELAAKAAEDDTLRAMLARATSDRTPAPERLQRIIERNAKTAAADLNLTGQNAQMRSELARLKGNGGSGLPYCWTTLDGHPLYMLRVELHDDGIVVHEIDPRTRPDDSAWQLLSNVPRGTLIQMSAFLSQVGPLQTAGATAKCRYAVQAFDATAATNKPGYKSLMGHLWTAFMVHEVRQ